MAATKTTEQPASQLTVHAKFAAARREMSAAMIERDDEIDLTLVTLLAGENLLLVGPPGVAKSMLLRSLLDWIDGQGFELLLSKNTLPEELFGPISLAAFKEERYRRVTRGRLPEAHLAFLDEIWKSGPAILNTLLKILNERTFENDGIIHDVPLRMVVAASNEWPSSDTGKELSALLDRFLVRKTVRPIATETGKLRLLDFDGSAGGHRVRFSTRISLAEIDQARDEASSLPFTEDAKEAFLTILRELAREGIVPGDRRQYKAVGVCRAAAYLDGADEVRREHLDVLRYVLWDDPAEQPEKTAKIVARTANPIGAEINGYLVEASEIMGRCDVNDIAQAATASAALKEIVRKLNTHTGHHKAGLALIYVKGEIKRIGQITARGMSI